MATINPQYEVSDARPKFQRLVKLWRDETQGYSSAAQMAMHPAYQQVIGMGPIVVPLVLEELEREPAHWFWALRALTGENPVPQPSQGDVAAMTAAWLEWGRQRGYLAE